MVRTMNDEASVATTLLEEQVKVKEARMTIGMSQRMLFIQGKVAIATRSLAPKAREVLPMMARYTWTGMHHQE